MALPRRCGQCKCYVADQLKRCPRCNRVVPPRAEAVVATKEDREAARAKADAKVPLIHAKNMRWRPSLMAIASHRALMHEVQEKIKRADTPRLRNALRSELRQIKTVLARARSEPKQWTTEIFHTKHASVYIFVSPKQHKYVLAGRDDAADLIIQNRRRTGVPFTRLMRIEKSPLARQMREQAKAEAVEKKRRKAKRDRKQQKRERVRTLAKEA